MTTLMDQKINGQQIIAGQECLGEGSFFKAFNPSTAQHIEPTLSMADQKQVKLALTSAAKVSVAFSQSSLGERARFLHLCAQEFLAIREPLLARASLETGYEYDRLSIEFERTYQQFLFYADVVINGHFLDIRIDQAKDSQPDLRFVKQAIGPVAVFGASNFPLAYSVAGGDTVAALAAGCPVIVKGHHSHPGTCELVAKAIVAAIKQTKLPLEIFSMVLAQGNALGEQLVNAPEIKAVAFTGSFNGGLALYQLASQRPVPIPVFAEMGSLNPVVFLPDILAQNAKALALEYSQAFTQSAGQFCVNPSLILAVKSKGLSTFSDHLVNAVSKLPAKVMLNSDIFSRYIEGTEQFKVIPGVKLLTPKPSITDNNTSKHINTPTELNSDTCYSDAKVFQTTAQNFIENKELHHEIFGHSSLLVVCDSIEEVEVLLTSLEGQLSAALHGSTQELIQHQVLFDLLQQKVGRIVINGFTNGVTVGHATMHGGPFPATTDSRFTSVGSAAIGRFIRPVCFQNTPDELLPEVLKNANPWKITRLLNGVLTVEPVV